MQSWTATTRHGITRKRSSKRLKINVKDKDKGCLLVLEMLSHFLDHRLKKNILWAENSRVI